MEIRIKSFFAVGATLHMGGSSGRDARDLAVDVKPGATVSELLERIPSLGPPGQFEDIMLHVFVNGQLKGFDYVLQPGDVVDLHIPVSGG